MHRAPGQDLGAGPGVCGGALTMLFATLDVDIPEDPLFIALEAAGEPWPWWWMRLIQVAKRHNRRGRLCHFDGRPLGARDLALVHHRTLQRAEEWEQMLETCLGLGLLVQDDDGAYRIADWKRWHRSPSDDPEETRARKAMQRERQRRNDQSRCVTSGHESHDTEQSRAEQSRDRAEQQQSIAHAREGLAAAAGSDDYIGSGNGLEPIRPAIAQAMQRLGILAAPSGTWWTSVTAWAAPAIAGGATLDDVQDAIRYGADKSAHDRPRRPWPYAMTIASEEIGQIARRNQMRRDWEAGGRRGPEPLPYVWTPEDTCNR